MAVEVFICGDHLGQLHRTLCDLREAGFDHIRIISHPIDMTLATPPPLEAPTARIDVARTWIHCAASFGRLRHGRMCVDPAGHQVRIDDELVDVTPSEFTVLTTLLRHRGIVLSRSQLLEALHGCEAHTPNAIEAHISGLRRRFADFDFHPIETVRAVGYVIRKDAPPPIQRDAR